MNLPNLPNLPILLILLPLVCGLVITSIKMFDVRKYFVFASSLLLAILSVYCIVQYRDRFRSACLLRRSGSAR